MIFISCKGKEKKQSNENKQNIESKHLSEIDEVTAAVSALLPSPNSFHLKQAKKWHDAWGENWLVLYETGPYQNKDASTSSAKLSAVLYLKTDSGFTEQWKMIDFINDCELDLTCSFYDDHLSITDLDSNGLAEITMVYALSCKGDVSPNEKKLIMYEGRNKYAIRGEELMILQKDTIGGTNKPDSAFNNAPAPFLSFAKEHWKKFGFQKFD